MIQFANQDLCKFYKIRGEVDRTRAVWLMAVGEIRMSSGNQNLTFVPKLDFHQRVLSTNRIVLRICNTSGFRFVKISNNKSSQHDVLTAFVIGDPSGNQNLIFVPKLDFHQRVLSTNRIVLRICNTSGFRFVKISNNKNSQHDVLTVFVIGDPSGNRTRVSSVRG